MKTWGCVAIAWAAFCLSLGWSQPIGGGWLALVALAVAPMAVWALAWARRHEAKGLRAIEAEALAWEPSTSETPR